MKQIIINLLVLLSFATSYSQATGQLERPKLVVGIVIDQMRWDYLYRYYDRYADNGGFKRLLHNGFSCDNTTLPYIPSVTACGHTSMYTGTVPAIHGITGNDWYDEEYGDFIYCVEDTGSLTIGSTTLAAGSMSPRNMVVTTICDELKMATNFRSRVIGIAIKDRCGILPAGHSADAAYWYDTKTGNWISSDYYMKQLPPWLNSFNARKLVDSFYTKGWSTLYPINTYIQSTEDNVAWEHKLFGQGFPYDMKSLVGKNYNPIIATPHGNTLTTMLVKEAIVHEELGKDRITDFLSISYSSPDYTGHSYGPNSVEEEDLYLRLDKELADLMDFLDSRVGKGQYLLFLSADHGVANVPGFMKEHKIPAGNLGTQALLDSLNKQLSVRFSSNSLAMGISNYQLVLNHSLIDSLKLDRTAIKQFVTRFLSAQKGIQQAIDIEQVQMAPIQKVIREKIVNGYFRGRSGDIQLILSPQWIEGFESGGTSHGVWNPYDAHIPLLWYGWKIRHGQTHREVNITDIVPTLSALLNIQVPSGSIGKVIDEIIQ